MKNSNLIMQLTTFHKTIFLFSFSTTLFSFQIITFFITISQNDQFESGVCMVKSKVNMKLFQILCSFQISLRKCEALVSPFIMQRIRHIKMFARQRYQVNTNNFLFICLSTPVLTLPTTGSELASPIRSVKTTTKCWPKWYEQQRQMSEILQFSRSWQQ